MASERAVLEMNQRVIAIMLFYRGGHRRPSDKARMVAEIQEVAAWYRAARINGADLDQRVLQPIAAGLIDRHGKIVGPRVYAEFLAALTTEPDPAEPSVCHERSVDGSPRELSNS